MATLALVQKCRTCLEVKPGSQFFVRHDTGRLRGECKTCTHLRSMEWRKANPDHVTRAKYIEAHK